MSPPERVDTGAGDPGRRELLVQTRMFLGIGVVVAVMAGIYLVVSYEEAGSVMLVLAASLSLVCGVYLWVQLRRTGTHDHGEREELYLPHASIWPFWIGVAAFLITNGLILGIWFLVPGALVLVAALAGMIRQSRART